MGSAIERALEPERFTSGLVFVPARPVTRDGVRQIMYEARDRADGVRAMPAFTTLDRLVEQLGPAQPWAQLPLASLRALLGEAGVTQVDIDPVVDAAAVRWDTDSLHTLAAGQTTETGE